MNYVSIAIRISDGEKICRSSSCEHQNKNAPEAPRIALFSLDMLFYGIVASPILISWFYDNNR